MTIIKKLLKMIDEEIEVMYEDFTKRLSQQGFSFEMYSQMTGQDEAAVREQMAPEAAKKVKVSLVLDAIAEAEGIEITENDVELEFAKIADQYSMEVEKVKGLISADSLAYDLRVQAAIEVVKSK